MQSYVVQVNDPPKYFAPGYFPRKFKYKKDAIAIAELAVERGATMARVECPNGGEIDFRPNPRVTTASPSDTLFG